MLNTAERQQVSVLNRSLKSEIRVESLSVRPWCGSCWTTHQVSGGVSQRKAHILRADGGRAVVGRPDIIIHHHLIMNGGATWSCP